jgi:hypothetical protein
MHDAAAKRPLHRKERDDHRVFAGHQIERRDRDRQQGGDYDRNAAAYTVRNHPPE